MPSGLLSRVLFILILGAMVVVFDIVLFYSFYLDAEPTLVDWILLLFLVLGGLGAVAYLISFQLIKPLKNLSGGAIRFSKEMHNEPIPLVGPTEVKDAAASFNQMQAHVERFIEERMQLIAAISHDLRTPLTRLRLRVDSISDEQQRNKALADIDNMNAIVMSVLSFIRDDAKQEKVVKTDLTSLICTICDEISDTFGPAVCNETQSFVTFCKPTAMKRALNNVIENGVKYGEEVLVVLRRQGETILIEITDRGPGVEEDELEKIFIPFYRVEKSRNRETGGVGLGLSVAKTLTKDQGGELKIENTAPCGLKVSISLPIKEVCNYSA